MMEFYDSLDAFDISTYKYYRNFIYTSKMAYDLYPVKIKPSYDILNSFFKKSFHTGMSRHHHYVLGYFSNPDSSNFITRSDLIENDNCIVFCLCCHQFAVIPENCVPVIPLMSMRAIEAFPNGNFSVDDLFLGRKKRLK